MTDGANLPAATDQQPSSIAASRSRQRAKSAQVLAICFGEVLEGTYVTLPYTVAAYMVRGFLQGSTLPPKDLEAKIGLLTGLLASTFPAAQFCTSFPLGLLSNRIGRKPILVLSQVSGVVTTIAFGMSPSYALAFSSRFLGGALNNVGGTVRVMLSEICDPEMLPGAMSFQAIGWGLGTILGPMLGGALSSPCATFGPGFPLCDPGSLFHARPFLLPCIAAACLGMVGVGLSLFVVQESLPRMTGAARYAPVMELTAMDFQDDDSDPAADRSALQDLNAQESPHRTADRQKPARSKLPAEGSRNEDSENQDPSLIIAGPAEAESTALNIADAQAKPHWQQPGHDEEQAPLMQNGIASKSALPAVPWFKQQQVIMALLFNTANAGFFNYLDELRPIFASAPVREGGLGLTTDVLAWSLGFGGIAFMLYSYYGFERLHALLGSNWTSRTGWLLLAATAMMSVLPSLFPLHPVWVQVCLFAAMAINALADTNGYVGCALLLNKSAPHDLAAVNGASQTFAALVRAAGPALSGLAWGAAIRSGLPQHQLLPFAFIALAAAVLQHFFTAVKA